MIQGLKQGCWVHKSTERRKVEINIKLPQDSQYIQQTPRIKSKESKLHNIWLYTKLTVTWNILLPTHYPQTANVMVGPLIQYIKRTLSSLLYREHQIEILDTHTYMSSSFCVINESCSHRKAFFHVQNVFWDCQQKLVYVPWTLLFFAHSMYSLRALYRQKRFVFSRVI